MTSNALPTPAPRRDSPWRAFWELIGSMRFAIALLSVICIASVIGTVVKQHEPYNNYVNQFGPFWAEVFDKVGLYAVYSAGWFLLILAFLVVSTSLCIARNAPKIVADWRTFKETIREGSLKAFHHRGEARWSGVDDAQARARVDTLLDAHGWQARADVRPNGTMVAARRGKANKLGYLAAHSAIVLICLGGLADGDLIVRAQMALRGVTPTQNLGRFADVGPEHRLGAGNPTFRGNLYVPEGQRSGVAMLSMSDGVVLQELPFDVELKKFIVEYYDTGMPKLFASDVVIHDRAAGTATPARIKVNEPFEHRGVVIYQSSFDDGGSKVKLRVRPLTPNAAPFAVDGTIGGDTTLVPAAGVAAAPLKLEFAALRVINVENLGAAAPTGAASATTDVRAVDLVGSAVAEHLGSGAKGKRGEALRNVGPSITYRLRDASGQAREFHNYMLPVDIEGQRMFLAGVRESPNEAFRYLRIPADANDSADTWWRVAQALRDPAARSEAVRRYVAKSTPADKPEMAEHLTLTAERALALFAGAQRALSAAASAPGTPAAADDVRGGLPALSAFIENTVPEPERPRIAEVLLRIVNGTLFELTNLSRERHGAPALAADDTTRPFMTQTVLALSDAAYYPAPLVAELQDFTQVQASVFQVARAPGKLLVYLGAVLLIVGVFAMLYVRERRLWIWLGRGDGGTDVRFAMSTTRRTLDADAEFETLRATLRGDSSHTAAAPASAAGTASDVVAGR